MELEGVAGPYPKAETEPVKREVSIE